jgi:hypothetical protein
MERRNKAVIQESGAEISGSHQTTFFFFASLGAQLLLRVSVQSSHPFKKFKIAKFEDSLELFFFVTPLQTRQCQSLSAPHLVEAS